MLRLRELRENRGIKSMSEMARIFNMAYMTYVSYETGKREPDIATIKRLANYFGVSTDYLIGNTDNPDRKFLMFDGFGVDVENAGLPSDISLFIDKLNLLNHDGQMKALAYIDDLIATGLYKEDTVSKVG